MANQLHVVNDGEEAIHFLRQGGGFTCTPRPGLVLLDLNLPRRHFIGATGKVDQSFLTLVQLPDPE